MKQIIEILIRKRLSVFIVFLSIVVAVVVTTLLNKVKYNSLSLYLHFC